MVATLLTVLAAFTKMADPTKERTFIAVKPDGVQRGLIGDIMKRFEQRGYKLVASKLCMVRMFLLLIYPLFRRPALCLSTQLFLCKKTFPSDLKVMFCRSVKAVALFRSESECKCQNFVYASVPLDFSSVLSSSDRSLFSYFSFRVGQ